ncbi:hypothetical protein L2725_04765 [Shewanella corallii]|uniref:Uncharacterized protein n=1 Tax=Shewanella corallii TaxID=560080 RepID=A0ABT0N5E1_9GAMM|nr:hypothetical protein [Shewanella corallii]MCL2913096.1 hypothetical protein [Shewanella corallii]
MKPDSLPQKTELSPDKSAEQPIRDLPPELSALLDIIPESSDKEEFASQLLDTLDKLASPSRLSEKIPAGTTKEKLPAVIAKQPDGQQTLHDEQAQMAEDFMQLFADYAPGAIELPLEAIRQLSNADLPVNPDDHPQFDKSLFDMWRQLPSDLQPYIQAFTTMQMAGFEKSAELLQRAFVDRVLIHNNSSFQSLQTEIAKQHGVTQSAAKHSLKGQTSRHSKNRDRKEYALSLYKQKPYDNPSQARTNHYPAIEEYANSIGHPFSSEYQGMKTVYSWFLQELKNK